MGEVRRLLLQFPLTLRRDGDGFDQDPGWGALRQDRGGPGLRLLCRCHLLAAGEEPDEPVPPLADQVEHGTASRMSKVCPDRIVLDCFLFR